jgi:hypothetical protein
MVIWTDYLKHRAQLRGFDLATIEQIVHFSEERYFDTTTQRMVAIGRHGSQLVMIPYEQAGETLSTRQSIICRFRTGDKGLKASCPAVSKD